MHHLDWRYKGGGPFSGPTMATSVRPCQAGDS
jgi:hypothetical protein